MFMPVRQCFLRTEKFARRRAQCWLRANLDLPRADDRDEVVAGRALAAACAARGDRTGNLVAIDLAEGRGLREFVGFAVRVRRRGAALGAGGQAAVYAIAVGIVGDDEHFSLGSRRTGGGKAKHGHKTEENCPHKTPNASQRLTGRVAKMRDIR